MISAFEGVFLKGKMFATGKPVTFRSGDYEASAESALYDAPAKRLTLRGTTSPARLSGRGKNVQKPEIVLEKDGGRIMQTGARAYTILVNQTSHQPPSLRLERKKGWNARLITLRYDVPLRSRL